MKRNLIVLLVAVVVVVILAFTCLFIVEEGYQAIVLRFGRIVDTHSEAGLKFKLPWDTVEIYSKKILSWDGRSDRIPTEQSEAQFIFVNTTARWRIVDMIKFYSKLGNRQSALNKLDVILDSAVRTVISNNLLLEAVRSTKTDLAFTVSDFENFPNLVRSLVRGGSEEVVTESVANLSSDVSVTGERDRNESDLVFNAVAQYAYNSIDVGRRRQLDQLTNVEAFTRSQVNGIVAIFNDMLDDPDLYEEKRFQDINLIAHAESLLAKEELTSQETRILNRLLLEAAFPQFIKVSPVKKGRVELSREMLTQARKEMYESSVGEELEEGVDGKMENQFGIELIDVVIRQIKYSDDLKESVYNRMIKERNQIAAKTRYEGIGEKENILGKLKNEVEQIRSRARKEAEEIKGEADAEATRIYADSYQRNPEFFRFWRTLESYKTMLPRFEKTLTTDADYFNYLYNQSGR